MKTICLNWQKPSCSCLPGTCASLHVAFLPLHTYTDGGHDPWNSANRARLLGIRLFLTCSSMHTYSSMQFPVTLGYILLKTTERISFKSPKREKVLAEPAAGRDGSGSLPRRGRVQSKRWHARSISVWMAAVKMDWARPLLSLAPAMDGSPPPQRGFSMPSPGWWPGCKWCGQRSKTCPHVLVPADAKCRCPALTHSKWCVRVWHRKSAVHTK